jgi:hypothetical protein
MATKTKGKMIQMLNPENYIRQKAKGLPICECLISSDWEESRFANIIIARQHSNGNITACVYLADLMCLGIKDSLFIFNTPMSGYNEMVDLFKGDQPVVPTSYALVHNVIYAAVEYAEEWGFKPHKVFTSVTRFMLEDDTDYVELIDIECGRNGKPCFVKGDEDSDSDVKRILAQLERTAGKGNYDFIIDEEDVYDDEFSDMTFDQKHEEFLEFNSRFDLLNEDEKDRLFNLAESLVADMIDGDRFDEAYDEIIDEIEFDIDDDTIPDEMLGLELGSTVSVDVKQLFIEVLEKRDDLIEMKKLFAKFKKIENVKAASDYLELIILDADKAEKFDEKIADVAAKYPNYALIQLEYIKHRLIKSFEQGETISVTHRLASVFPGRTSIHPWEYFCYLNMLIFFIIGEEDFEKLQALSIAVEDVFDNEFYVAELKGAILKVQMEMFASLDNSDEL